MNSTMLEWWMSFQVLTSFLSALMKYSFVSDLFLERFILSIRFFFSIILQASTLPVFVSIARQVFAQLPSPNFLSFIEQCPSTTFSVCISSIMMVGLYIYYGCALADYACRSAELRQVEVRQVDVGQVDAEEGVALLRARLGFVFLDGLVGLHDQPHLVGVVVLTVLHHFCPVVRPAFADVEGLLPGKGLDFVGLVVPLASGHSGHLEPTAWMLALIRPDLPAVFLAVLEHAQPLVVGLHDKGKLVGVLENHELLSGIAHVVADLEFSVSCVGDCQRLGGVQHGEDLVGLPVDWREDCWHFLESVQASDRIYLGRLLISRDDQPYLVAVAMEAPLDNLRSGRCPTFENVQNLAAEGFYVESQPNELPILYWRNLEVSALVLSGVSSQHSAIIGTLLSNPQAHIGSRVDKCKLAIIVIDVKLLTGCSLVVIQHDILPSDREALGLIEGGEHLIESTFGLIEHAYKSIIS